MKRKLARFCALLGIACLAVVFALPVGAQHGGRSGGGYQGGRGGGGRGGGWHGGGLGWWGLGLGLGLGWEAAAIAGPYYPYGAYVAPGYDYPYDAAPVVVAPYPAPAVVQGGPAMAAPPSPAASANWYYCDSAKGYYPYITQCAEGWRSVPTTPPGDVR